MDPPSRPLSFNLDSSSDWLKLGAGSGWEHPSLIGRFLAVWVTWVRTFRANFGWTATSRRPLVFCFPGVRFLSPLSPAAPSSAAMALKDYAIEKGDARGMGTASSEGNFSTHTC